MNDNPNNGTNIYLIHLYSMNCGTEVKKRMRLFMFGVYCSYYVEAIKDLCLSLWLHNRDNKDDKNVNKNCLSLPQWSYKLYI